MNAGLANLATLKRHLLPETWLTETSMDTILADLGLGVASQMEEYCGRKFARAEDAMLEIEATPAVIQVPRFPLEEVASIELKSAGSAAWEEQEGAIDNIAGAAGLIYLVAPIGTNRDRVRITYTGGFWWDTTEPTDELTEEEQAAAAMPETATAVPAGLQFNWLLQCQHILAGRELLATKTLPSGKAALAVAAEAQIQLLQTVKDALQPYRILAA